MLIFQHFIVSWISTFSVISECNLLGLVLFPMIFSFLFSFSGFLFWFHLYTLRKNEPKMNLKMICQISYLLEISWFVIRAGRGTLSKKLNQVNTCFTFQQVLYFKTGWKVFSWFIQPFFLPECMFMLRPKNVKW